jgi:hypothetical protein
MHWIAPPKRERKANYAVDAYFRFVWSKLKDFFIKIYPGRLFELVLTSQKHTRRLGRPSSRSYRISSSSLGDCLSCWIRRFTIIGTLWDIRFLIILTWGLMRRKCKKKNKRRLMMLKS